jgi:two-component system, OmpR family, heavy metal sensor histidine kinase CusS
MYLRKTDPRGRPLNFAIRSFKALSIKTRLTILFTLSGLGALIFASGFLYYALLSNVIRDDNKFLADETFRLTEALTKWDITTIKDEFIRNKFLNSPGFGSIIFGFRVMDKNSSVLLQTLGIQDTVPISAFPAPEKSLAKHKRGPTWKSNNGRTYLLLSTWSKAPMSSQRKVVLQTALDVTDDYRMMMRYAEEIVIVFTLAFPVLMLLGTAVARRGLRPLEEITDKVRSISATHLHERICSGVWPKELTGMAGAFDGMLDRLEDSFSRLSQFAADLAHEIRTPINNLMGEAEVVLTGQGAPDAYREVIESAIQEYSRLFSLIESLLFLARSENPGTRIERSLFDVSTELEKVSDYYEAMAEELGVTLTYSGSGFVAADPILFRRALNNLVSNALRHTSAGGKVEISAARIDDKFLEIIVSDTGSGISREHLPYVFNRFYRAGEGDAADHLQGAGLGLFIVKSIMDLHGGQVDVQSEPGKGTKMILRFPLTRE